MDDKQKQIEEMANDLKQIKFNMQGCFIPQYVGVHEDITARDLYELGYRKIPKGSVVLSNEEIEIQQENYLNGIKYWQDMANKARKQAVKEFAEMVKNDIKIYLTEDLDFLMKWREFKLFMDERAKAFGVEL